MRRPGEDIDADTLWRAAIAVLRFAQGWPGPGKCPYPGDAKETLAPACLAEFDRETVIEATDFLYRMGYLLIGSRK